MKCLRKPALFNREKCIAIDRINIKISVTQPVAYVGVNGKAIATIVFHKPGTEQYTIFCPLLIGTCCKGIAGGKREIDVGKMAKVCEPHLVGKIPHPHFHGIIKFLFYRYDIPAPENLVSCHLCIGGVKRIAYGLKLKLVAEPFFVIKFYTNGQQTGKSKHWISLQDHAAVFTVSRIEIMKSLVYIGNAPLCIGQCAYLAAQFLIILVNRFIISR